MLKIEVHEDAAAAARRAAAWIGNAAAQAIAARGRFVMALSGGSTPWQMLCLLAAAPVDWPHVQVAQVDERVADQGSPERNLTQLNEALLARVALAPEQVHPMPVDDEDLDHAAGRYAELLARLAGSPPVLDLVQLGLGPDGHTASLVPSDAVLEIEDAEVAMTGVYQGRRRMTLTYPALNRARRILWLVTGEAKAEILARFVAGDPTLPASHVNQASALVIADRAAARLAAGDAPL